MEYPLKLFYLLAILLVHKLGGAQKLELVEGSLTALDTTHQVSVEFYFKGMSIDKIPDQAHFFRAYRSKPEITKAFLSARDSLSAKAFKQGYASVVADSIPELVNDSRETPYHLIIKTVHWNSSIGGDEEDQLRMEYILMINPHRRIQEARYYMMEVKGMKSESLTESIASAYYNAGRALALALRNYETEP